MNKIRVGKRKENEIAKLYSQLNLMFDQTLKMIDMCSLLLKDQQNDFALDIIEEDTYMDELHTEMILSINNFILKEEPKAKDLRISLGIYSMSFDVERVADYFKNFAKTIIKTKIEGETQIEIVQNLLKELKSRIKETKHAFEKSSHELAKSIAKRDVEIDNLVDELNKELVQKLRKVDNEKEVNNFRRIILLSKGFERLGDHLVNICEQISFIERGNIYNYG